MGTGFVERKGTMSSLPADQRFLVNVYIGECPAKWNDWIAETEWGTLFQTTFWADRLCELWDSKPYYFVVHRRDSDHPVLLLLGMDVRSDLIPIGQTNPINPVVRIADAIQNSLGARRFQWFGQPVLLDQEVSGEAFKLLLLEVEHLCRRNQIPRVVASEFPNQARTCLPPSWEIKP